MASSSVEVHTTAIAVSAVMIAAIAVPIEDAVDASSAI